MYLSIKSMVLMLIGFMFATNAVALPTDRQQKLILKSAAASLNIETGISVYRGNVTVDQGTTHLLADTLTLHTNKQNELTAATAIGKPAHYRTIPRLGKPEFHADADMIEYYPDKNLIILIGNAIAKQENNTYRGPRIEYNTALQTVVSPESPHGQTTIVITNTPAPQRTH